MKTLVFILFVSAFVAVALATGDLKEIIEEIKKDKHDPLKPKPEGPKKEKCEEEKPHQKYKEKCDCNRPPPHFKEHGWEDFHKHGPPPHEYNKPYGGYRGGYYNRY